MGSEIAKQMKQNIGKHFLDMVWVVIFQYDHQRTGNESKNV